MNEPVTSILWSSHNHDRFYIGTRTGHFFICLLYKNSIQIERSIDFNIYLSGSSESEMKSIDFIAQDSVNGLTVVIASKDGIIGFLKNINEPKISKLKVFQQLPFKSIVETNPKTDVINFFDFYPNDQEFICIATNIPFIQTPNCKFISILDNEKDKVIIGNKNEITVWKLVDQFWNLSCTCNLTVKLGQPEILTYAKLNNKILLTTTSNWLTEIEYRRKKIFVTKRIKFLDGKPIDFDFGNGSIAFVSKNGTISLTKMTPKSVIKPKFAVESKTTFDDHHLPLTNSSEGSYNESLSNSSNTLDFKKISRRKSMTFETGGESKHRMLFKPPEIKEESDETITISKDDSLSSTNDYIVFDEKMIEYNSEQNKNHNNTVSGNSNTISLLFTISSGEKNVLMKKVEWISNTKLVVWNKNALYLIDLEKRNVTEPLAKIFDKKSNFISRIFFSKSHKLMCMILNDTQAYVVKIESKF